MDLDTRQRRILELLSINCRFSNKDIAKIVRLSEDAVAYQIRKLITEQRLGKFSIQFDYRFLGYDHYHLLISLNTIDFDLPALMKIPTLSSINTSYGKYDLQLIAIARTTRELDDTIKRVEELLDIRDIAIAKYESTYKRFTNIIAPIALATPVPPRGKNPIYELRDRSYAMAREIVPIILDDIDKRIIKHLLIDPRVRLRILAQKIGINSEMVRYRINSYVKRDFIINFGLLHDFKKYGLSTHYLLLKIKSLDIPSFRSYLENNTNIFYSAKLLGEYNCIIYITSQDPDSFASQLKAIRRLIGKSLITMDLLHLETVHKYVQFPEGLLR